MVWIWDANWSKSHDANGVIPAFRDTSDIRLLTPNEMTIDGIALTSFAWWSVWSAKQSQLNYFVEWLLHRDG